MTPPHTGTTFFTPTGPVFSWFSLDVSAFTCTFALRVTVFARCYRAVLRVLRVSCVSGVLPLLTSCDRVSGSCDLVWSWSRGLVTVNPRYYYRITLNTITMEEHDIDALIAWKYDTYVDGLDTESDEEGRT